jgi:hypothetical protein
LFSISWALPIATATTASPSTKSCVSLWLQTFLYKFCNKKIQHQLQKMNPIFCILGDYFNPTVLLNSVESKSYQKWL